MPNNPKHDHQQHQQPKTTSESANYSEPSEGKYPTEQPEDVHSVMRPPETPRQRAIRFVHENLEGMFFHPDPTTSRRLADAVMVAIAECPESDRVAFRDEGKKICMELRQFSEMLNNEFVFQTSVIK